MLLLLPRTKRVSEKKTIKLLKPRISSRIYISSKEARQCFLAFYLIIPFVC